MESVVVWLLNPVIVWLLNPVIVWLQNPETGWLINLVVRDCSRIPQLYGH